MIESLLPSQMGRKRERILCASSKYNQPCRCLCFGLLQMIRTTRLRRMTLQLRQISFTDALTFITASPREPANAVLCP